jgi:hypothetical protein
MKIIFTFVVFILLMFVVSFSFAVRNAIGWEVVEIPQPTIEEQVEGSFMAAKPIECTFDETIIEEYIKATGEEPLAKAQAWVTDGTEVYQVEVMLYVNLAQKTFSVFEVYPDGSACLSLQANNLDIFSFGLNT